VTNDIDGMTVNDDRFSNKIYLFLFESSITVNKIDLLSLLLLLSLLFLF